MVFHARARKCSHTCCVPGIELGSSMRAHSQQIQVCAHQNTHNGLQVCTGICLAYLEFMSSKLSVFVLKVSADESCRASCKTVPTSPPGDPRQAMVVPLIIKAKVRVTSKTDAVSQVGCFVQPNLSPFQARVTSTAAVVLALWQGCWIEWMAQQ